MRVSELAAVEDTLPRPKQRSLGNETERYKKVPIPAVSRATSVPRGGDHHICGTTEDARTIGSPGLQLNAFAKDAMLDTGPFVRHTAGACGSTVTRVFSCSGRVCSRHDCA